MVKHFLLFYDTAPDYLERRGAFRGAHLALAWAAAERGELVLGGALVSNLFQLPVLGWLIRNSIPALLVAIPILFQPELRRALEHLGHLRGMLPSHVVIGNQGHQIEVLTGATLFDNKGKAYSLHNPSTADGTVPVLKTTARSTSAAARTAQSECRRPE